jgi:hypothetical protein
MFVPDIDPTDRAAFGALEVGGYVVPIPVGQIGDHQSTVVVASVAFATEAVHPNRA